MPRRHDPLRPAGARDAARLARVALLAGALALAAGCGHKTPESKTFLVGRHRVRLADPPGWEHLDHGREQLFRNRESELELSLADLGPVPSVEGSADSLEQATAMVLRRADDSGPGREIVGQEPRVVHGVVWSVVDTWSRVSHLDRKRVAWLDDGGYVLALRMKRGDAERAGLVFDLLLRSIEAAPDSSRLPATPDTSRAAAGSP